MTSTTAPAGRRGLGVGLGVAGILYVLLLVLAPELLNDPDSYWHVAVGRDILASGSLPTNDPYSFTMVGEPWIAKEWLSQVLFATAFEVAGWPGVVVLAGAAAALAFACLAVFLRQRLDLVPTVVLLGVAFLLSAPHLLARPHVLALPIMVTWVAGLTAAADRASRPRWRLLLLMVLWANLHGSFLLGIVLAIALGVDAVVRAGSEVRTTVMRRWAGFAALSALAGMVTPYGYRTLVAGIDVLRLGDGLRVITEWQPQDFSSLGVFEVVLLVAVGLALVTPFTLRWPRAVILLGLLHLGLSAVRNGDVLGLLAPVVLAAPLGRHLPRRAAMVAARRTVTAAVLFALVAVPVTILTLQRDGLAPARRTAPIAAVQVLETEGVNRVFNDYSFGGYLIHAGVPTFIDGRTELFGAEAVVRHDRAVRLDPPGVLVELLDGHDVEATLLQPGSPAIAYLDATDGWERLHTDDIAVVHARTNRS